MSITGIIVDIALMAAATVVAVVVIGTFARRVLGVRIGVVRIVIAGALGLGAELGFESQYVWTHEQFTPALIPVQIGIILLVANAFLVIAELVVPQGSIPRPDRWLPALRSTKARAQRYSELARIAVRHRLVPFKLTTEPTSAAAAERSRQAKALKAALEDAGGAFVKLGQLLSTRTDALPAEFTRELRTLQQSVPPAPWAQVSAVLESELARPLDEVFQQIDHAPIASASIGQVHRATLASGRRVAVKVQRAGIIPLVERDVEITRRIAARLTESTEWARRFGIAELAESLASSLLDELDYRIEASNITAMDAAQQLHPPEERVHIPRQYPELTSRRVLVMEFVVGTTLSDPGSAAALTARRRSQLARRLLRSAFGQMMDDGVFHADLHPGNVMVTPHGDLALLDFGSVGRLDSVTRRQLTDLLLAFSRSDARAFADALIAFVDIPDDMDEAGLRRQIGAFMSRYLGVGGSLDLSAFAQVITVLAANGLAVPPQLTVASRSVATVEGTLRALDPRFDFVAEAAEYAQVRMDAAQRPSALAHEAADELAGLWPLARRLPYRIDRITGSLADGRLNLNIRLLADRRDREVLRSFINLASITFLAGVFGIMAAMLLTSSGGPHITATLTLYQLFGFLLVVASGILTLRTLFDVFRRHRPR